MGGKALLSISSQTLGQTSTDVLALTSLDEAVNAHDRYLILDIWERKHNSPSRVKRRAMTDSIEPVDIYAHPHEDCWIVEYKAARQGTRQAPARQHFYLGNVARLPAAISAMWRTTI